VVHLVWSAGLSQKFGGSSSGWAPLRSTLGKSYTSIYMLLSPSSII